MRVGRLVWVAVLLVLCGSSALAQGDVFARARRMVNEGDAKAGRALVDSMLAAAPASSPAYAEALYWRAVLAEEGEAARTDLLRVAVEFPFSPRASDALLRLAQAEFTRGDRDAAMRHLSMLVRDHPDAPSRAAAKYWTARIHLEDARPVEACAALADARGLVAAGDVELRNQIEYYARGCAQVAADDERTRQQAERARIDSLAADSARRADEARRAAEGAAAAARAKGRWSVQVAAYGDRDGALALVKKLEKRGFDARVTATKPWRVRVGHFATRAEAAEVAARLSSKGNKAQIVDAEGR